MTRPLSRRLLSGLLTNLPSLLLFAAIAYPALAAPDLPVWVYLVAVALLQIGGRAAIDEESLTVRHGHDQRNQLLVGLSLLAGQLVGIFEFARLEPIIEVPVIVRWAGIVLVVLGYGLRIWAVHTNRFFSGLINVQQDRGHQVVRSGPYRAVRHPGYASLLLVFVGSPAALSSVLALVTALVGLYGLFSRTAREDRYLAENLAGYRDYQSQVRNRLIPGLY